MYQQKHNWRMYIDSTALRQGKKWRVSAYGDKPLGHIGLLFFKTFDATWSGEMCQLVNCFAELFRQLLGLHAVFFINRGIGKWTCNGWVDMTGQTTTAIFSPLVSWCRRKPSQAPSTIVYLFIHSVRWKSPNTGLFTLLPDFPSSF